MHNDVYGAELPRTCCDRSIARSGLPGLECILQVEQCSGAPNANKGPIKFRTVGNGVPRERKPGTGRAYGQQVLQDGKSVVEGKWVSVRVDLGGRRRITKKHEHISRTYI